MNGPEIAAGGPLADDSAPVLVTLPVARLTPNDYNPNRMTEDEFAELVAEVRHLGRLPKPLVVRFQGDAYLIVDGEHNWRAAQEAGVAEVSCEVMEADDFEAMRQTYKRNQHGTHDPVRLGRMFRRMMEERQLSGRGLAEEIGISEGTVRNALAYAEAADLRNSYAAAGGEARETVWLGKNGRCRDATPDEEIAGLPIREVRAYGSLPAPIRDVWFNTGHSLESLDRAMRPRLRLNEEDGSGKEATFEVGMEVFEDVVEAGLGEAICGQDFVDSCHCAFRIWHWRDHWKRHFKDVDELDTYILPVARLGLDVDVLDALPIKADQGRLIFVISAQEWQETLAGCQERAQTKAEFWELFAAGVRLGARRHGYEPEDLTDPRVVDAKDRLATAPGFIRDAERLSLWEKLWLHELKMPDLDEDAKADVVSVIETRRNMVEQHEEYAAAIPPAAVDLVVQERLEVRRRDKEHEAEMALHRDPERLLRAFLEKAREYHTARTYTIGGRPVLEVLEERVSALPLPERLLLFRAVVFGDLEDGWWLAEVAKELGQEPIGKDEVLEVQTMPLEQIQVPDWR